MSYKLMVARFPALSQEHPDSSDYVIGLQRKLIEDERINEILGWKLSDTPITMSRNRCVKQALAAGVDYLLMIDSDMAPDCVPGAMPFWDVAWEFMMDRRSVEKDRAAGILTKYLDEECLSTPSETVPPPATIAAPYCGPPPAELCYVFRWASLVNDEPDNRPKLSMIDRDDAARRKGIEEVAALPTGLILYDMRVFRELPPPWYRYEWGDVEETIKATTEDVYQTRNASLSGLPQFCAWDCWAAHIKTKRVTKPNPITIRSMKGHLADAIARSHNLELV